METTNYRDYQITRCIDGTFLANTGVKWDDRNIDLLTIGYGHIQDREQKFTSIEMIKERIDEIYKEKEEMYKRVREYVNTLSGNMQRRKTEAYLMDDNSDHPYHSNAYMSHTYKIIYDGQRYLIPAAFGYDYSSKTNYLFQQFLIKNGYISLCSWAKL